MPLLRPQSALASILVLGHGWVLFLLAAALIAGIAPRAAALAAAVLLLEIVIALILAGGLSDLTLRDTGVLGLAICLTATPAAPAPHPITSQAAPAITLAAHHQCRAASLRPAPKAVPKDSGGGLEAVELAIRTAMARLGAGLLEDLARPGRRLPRPAGGLPCGP